MLPAKGPVLHRIGGAEPRLGLLVLGDSSAASVGVGSSEHGLASQLAGLMAERTGQAVHWRAAGFNSATAGWIRDYVVPNLPHEPWTHIVLSIGTNDTKNFHSVPRWDREFGTLLYALRAKWPEARLIWSPVVDMTRVPALPRTLAKILEIRAQAINQMGVRLCRERSAISAPRLPIVDPALGFSTDGFHASEAGYRAWAEHLVDLLLAED
jgi:lysophospholipase L1-like esterase